MKSRRLLMSQRTCTTYLFRIPIGNDERPLVNKIVDSYPNIEPIYYSPSDDEVAAAFDVAANMHDVPFPYSPAISSYFVMKLAKQHGIKVMLDGQGADEYLAGY